MIPRQLPLILASLVLMCLSAAGVAAQPRNVIIDVAANETSVAIDPTNTDRIVAGANLAYVFTSYDHGETWRVGTLSSELGVWGDPAVAFDDSGNVYYAHLSNPRSGSWIDRIVAQRSTDLGRSWDDGRGIHLTAGKQQDKEWMAVDFTGTESHGTIHATWTEFDKYGSPNPADRSRILYSKSTDRGDTWSPAVKLSEREGDCLDDDRTTEGAVPAVGPAGEVYVAWSDERGIMFDKSSDGGQTWGTDRMIAEQPGGWCYGIPGLQRCNGLPVTGCDVSNGPYRGSLYVSWTDQRAGLEDTDVWFIRSSDDGTTWTDPLRVNRDRSITHQFMSWMAVDRFSGFIYILYYDRRRFEDYQTDVILARSTDGGDSFTEQRVSEQPFVPNADVFLGDYVGVAAHDRTVALMWTRIDGESSSVVTATFRDSTDLGTAVRAERATVAALSCRAIRALGRDARTGVRFALPRRQRVRVDAFDCLGRHLGTVGDASFDAGEQTLWWTAPGSGPILFRVAAEDGMVGCLGG